MIDDVRLFNRPLTGTEVFLTKDITVSSNMDGLVAYWKMDEGIGAKAFDLTANDMHAFINGATFNSSTPAITNAAMTDEGGAYAIEGVNYSSVQSFTATPSKIFYQQYALEFNSAYEACATLTDFDLPDTATVEIVIHPFDLTSRQSLLNKGTGDFELFIENNLYKLTINGQTQDLGPASTAYQHISLTLNGATGQVQYFRNGTLTQTLSYSNLTGDWTGSAWQLAANTPGAPANFYTGLIDEVAFYDTTMTVANIQLNASQLSTGGTDAGNPYLLSYFPLDEGDGTVIDDYGPAQSGAGAVKDAPFSIITYRQKESPHVFRPSTRAVNVNASTTAASGIDFVDESTVTISGVIRFENTFCYQDSVEILVNGQSAFPRIFTDENGRFVGDFEPGVTVTLTPRFDEHVFFPGFFQARRLNRPIAGVLYQNQTKREVSGQITGGTCRLSIIPEGARVKVKIQALNDCYSRELLLDNADGNYRFTGLPPIPMAVAITEHSNNVIYNYFQIQGGSEIDLRLIEKDTVDFVYTAPPNVYIQPFPETGCEGSGVKTIDQSSPQNGGRMYTSNIRVFEIYDGGECYLDSFTLIVNNDIADQEQYEIQVDTTIYPLTYVAGLPNLGGDHIKFLQVTAQVNGALATEVEEVVVLGERSREATFTTASPAMPMLILRDPPGDGSSSSLTAGNTNCQTWSDAKMSESSTGRELNLDFGGKITTFAGLGGGVIIENTITNQLDFTGSIAEVASQTSTAEFCVTNEITYATTGGDAVFFGDADLYVGAAVNFEISATDVLGYPEICDFTFGNNVRMWPEGFGTKYVYSEWQIETDVIPTLISVGDTTSADNWKRIIQYNQDLKDAAQFRENITFDGLVSITETFSTSNTSSQEFSFDFKWTTDMNQTLGFEVFGNGQTIKQSISMGGGTTRTNGTTNTETNSVSFTLADDDPNDNFTIDIFDDPVFGTPVFKLRSGESMCPWEPGTLNREEVGFAIDRLTAVNVSENNAAIFRLALTNQGQTGNDPLIYTLGVVEGCNPDGALLKVDGEGFTGDPLSFQILPFETLDILLTVGKGPATYSYNDIGIFLASECHTVETFPYTADGFVGTPLEPQVLHTNSQLLRKIYIHPGWNWISYNINLTDASTNAALSSLTNPGGATIKGQTSFSSYAVLPGQPGAWYGSLNQLSHLTMYQYRSMSHDSLLLIGAPVDASTPMPIQASWNWIGYLPQQGMPVTDALSSLTPLNGDLVKGQFQFAQYVAGVGWIGNLNFMSSPNGYLLRISNPGTLVYPDLDNVQPDDEGQGLVAAAAPRNSPHQTYEQALRKVMLLNHWTVNPGDFEFSMNLIGIVDAGEAANALSEGDEIAAFVDGEVRGTSQVVYVESLDSYMVFLTVYANREGETMQLKWYDQSAQIEVPLVENFSFLVNALVGNVAEPFEFHTTTTSVAQAVDANAALTVFPNPAKDYVYFRFDANVNESIAIRVTDALGREVGRLTTEALGVRHTLEWNTRHLAAGLYVVTLHRADGSQVRQMFQVSK